jgi:ferredoxin
MNKDVELAIDRTRCDGHGMCAELLPELIRLDDWGYPIIGAGAVPGRLLPQATGCPIMALALRQP